MRITYHVKRDGTVWFSRHKSKLEPHGKISLRRDWSAGPQGSDDASGHWAVTDITGLQDLARDKLCSLERAMQIVISRLAVFLKEKVTVRLEGRDLEFSGESFARFPSDTRIG